MRLHIAYHNILKLFIGTSKCECTSLSCTLFDVQCCQSVIRNIMYKFMCRLNSSSNYILNDILTSSLMFTSRIHKRWNKLSYVNSWLWTLNYVVCQMLTYGPQSHVYWIYGPCWVRNKVIELNWIIIIIIWCACFHILLGIYASTRYSKIQQDCLLSQCWGHTDKKAYVLWKALMHNPKHMLLWEDIALC